MDNVIEELLEDFYLKYLLWVETDNQEYKFDKTTGLCNNVGIYCKKEFAHLDVSIRVFKNKMLNQMREDFLAAGLDGSTPFNMGSVNYVEESDKATCHENQKRINWVKEHVRTS